MKKLLFILIVCCSLNGFGQKRAIIIKKPQMEQLFKEHVSDSIFKNTEGRKLKRKEKKYKDIGAIVEVVRPLVFEKYMKHKKLSDSYQGHEFQGFWIIKSLSFKGEDGDVLVIVDNVDGEIISISHIDIINELSK
jgi:hypothetical protein